MKTKQWLISWIGKTDLIALEKEGGTGAGIGPIADALMNSVRYDRVCLLTNLSHSQSSKYCDWLESKCGYFSSAIDLQEIGLISPINYASIYHQACGHLKALGLPRDDVELTYHLSPGTPAMAAVRLQMV